jgi:hypothetical protein
VTLREVIRPEECPKQIVSLCSAEQTGRYSEGSHNKGCWFIVTHCSLTKRLDNSLSRKEEVLIGGKERGMSPLSVRRNWPSGEKATAVTWKEWPSSVLQHDPVTASHSRTVLSLDADATSWPSGEKATAVTWEEWPSSVLRQAS